MIIQELYEERPDGTKLIRTYSDENKYIRKKGTLEIYAEAIDLDPVQYEYEETDIDIESDEDEPTEQLEESEANND